MKCLVPDNFDVPQRLEHSQFFLRPLLISDIDKDYDAVMTSIPRLKGVLDPRSNWPENLTFEQELIDLGWHHKEFQKRRSFAYTVMSPDESVCLGCVYIYPSDDPAYDAEAYCWVRTSAAELDPILFEVFKDWLSQKWPFKRVTYPRRE